MIDAIIWDAGGTLFNTYPSVVRAAQTALAVSEATVSSERLLSLFRESTQYALDILARELSLNYGALAGQFEDAYEAVEAVCQPPFPYVIEVCRYVVANEGRNFIVTHRGARSLMDLLEAHDMVSYFSDWITKEDPYPRKPDPASMLAITKRHRLDPECCLAVGDRELDILAGRRAGLMTCIFGDDDAGVSLADLRVAAFSELLRWLQADGVRCDG